MRDLEEKAAKLLETATKLPPGPERHGLLNEIGTFRAPIAVIIAKLSKNSCSQPSKAASVGGLFHCPSKFEISAERRDQHHAHDGAAADTLHAVQDPTKMAFSGFKLALFEPQ